MNKRTHRPFNTFERWLEAHLNLTSTVIVLLFLGTMAAPVAAMLQA